MENPGIELSFYAGLTATYATGDITQLEDELSEGTLRKIDFNSDGVGMGPGILAELYLWHGVNFSFRLDAGVNFILYNQDFPAGGDRYNFMWRAGPVVNGSEIVAILVLAGCGCMFRMGKDQVLKIRLMTPKVYVCNSHPLSRSGFKTPSNNLSVQGSMTASAGRSANWSFSF